MKSCATSYGCLIRAATSNFSPIHELVNAGSYSLAHAFLFLFCVLVIFQSFFTMKQENFIIFAHVTYDPVAPLGLPCNTIRSQRPLPAKLGGGRFDMAGTRQPCM